MALDPRRVADIAQKMYGAVAGANQELSDHNDAKALATKAGEDLRSKREVILGSVADLSVADDWTELEIKAAAKAAAQMHNDATTKSAVATFVNDCQRAAHPRVRARFNELFEIVRSAWLDEEEQRALDKDAPAPIKKLFKRKYHALLGTFKIVIDGVNSIDDVQDLIDYANANDPDFDADKIAKKLEKIVDQLSDFNVDFPMTTISDAIKRLSEIDAKDLAAARADKIAGKPVYTNVSPDERKVASATVAKVHPFAKPTTQKVTNVTSATKPAKPAVDYNAAVDNILEDGTDGVDVELAEAAD